MKSVLVVLVLAVAFYFLFRPTTFTVKNDIFMYKSPEDVYTFMSDLKRTTEKHSTLGGACTLLKHRTRKNGVKEKLYLVERIIPLFWDYELPFNLETRLSLTKPNEELEYEFSVLRGYVLKLHSRLAVEKREGRAMPGSLLTEELTVTCPWLATTFVGNALNDSHKDTLISMRNGLESMYIPKDRTREREGPPGGKKEDVKKTEKKSVKKTEKKKAPSDGAGKKEQGAKKDEVKKPSKKSSQAKDGGKRNEGQAPNEKMRKTLSKDEGGHQPKRAEAREEAKAGSAGGQQPKRAEAGGKAKAGSAGGQQPKKAEARGEAKAGRKHKVIQEDGEDKTEKDGEEQMGQKKNI